MQDFRESLNMGNSCPPSIRHALIPLETESGLRFSNRQIALLKELAREFRTRFMVPRLQNKAMLSHGTLALFSGPRGTGKTIGAEIVARELGLSVYRVNLKQVVSKYIGETEKNLARVFMTAEKKQAVLLFDEADALFKNRSEVKNSRDRNANIERSFVMERLKSYPGLVILVSTQQQAALKPQVQCFLKYHLKFSPPLPAPTLKVR
jgi:SpoVK/Ycf46/Vps4 family AAA+-type ATPase